MKRDLMLTVREKVLEVVAHLQAEGTLAAPDEARARRDHCLPTLRRFAAGDDMSADDLHRAIWSIECAAVVAEDHELAQKAGWASNYALLACSAGHRDMIEGTLRDAVASFNWRAG